MKFPAPAIAQGAPFKIGLLTVKTGPLAQGGIQMEQGIVTFLKEKNYTLAGRKVELLVADTGGNPAGARTKAQEVIERDKVNVILGPLAAFELLAITDYVRDNATPLISLAAAEDVTQRRANPFIIRPSATSAQCCHVMGDYATKELKYRRTATISEDFAFGHEQMAGFQRVFEDNGGKVVKKLWPQLVTPDYTPFIAQIGNVDCVFNGFAGSNPVKFMRSYADLGLKAKISAAGRLDRHGRRLAEEPRRRGRRRRLRCLLLGRLRLRQQQALRGRHAEGLQRAARRLFGRHVRGGPVRGGCHPGARQPRPTTARPSPMPCTRSRSRTRRAAPSGSTSTATWWATCSSAAARGRAARW